MRGLSLLAAVALLCALTLGSGLGQEHSWDTVQLSTGEPGRIGDPRAVSQDTLSGPTERQLNLALILDASGSMNAVLPGAEQPKLVVAQEALQALVRGIPDNVRVGLWLYGHRYPQEPKDRSCSDIENAVPLGPPDKQALLSTVAGLAATGYTPIAETISRAAATLPGGEEQLNSIILLSDGEETCGGDPCALAAELKQTGDLTLHVIGYAVDQQAREQLSCVARASGGGYWDAEEPIALLAALEEAMRTSVAATLLRVEVVGPDSQQLGADVRLYAPGRDQRVRGYVAWQQHSVEPGGYDLVVRTLPPVLFADLNLPRATRTVIRIQTGALLTLGPAGREVSYTISDGRNGERLGIYSDTTFTAPGTYTVTVNNTTTGPIGVAPGEVVEIALGSIRAVTPEGGTALLDVYGTGGKRLGAYGGDILVVPGTYRAGINNSRTDTVRIPAGDGIQIELGSVRPVAPTGRSMAVVLYDSEDRRLGSYSGDVLLVPGDYTYRIHNSRSEPFSVEPGESRRLVLGAVRPIGPEGQELGVTFFDDAGNRLGLYGGEVLLAPGTYDLESSGSRSAPVAVEPGVITEVQLGSVETLQSVELFDASGERLGSYRGIIALFPGTYLFRRGQDAPAESVEVAAGGVIRLD